MRIVVGTRSLLAQLVIALLSGCVPDGDHAPSSSAPSIAVRTMQSSERGAATPRTVIRRGTQFQSAVVGRRNPDGTTTTACFDNADSVAAFVRGAPVPAARVAQ